MKIQLPKHLKKIRESVYTADDLIEFEATQELDEEKQLSARVKAALKKKVDDHNEKHFEVVEKFHMD